MSLSMQQKQSQQLKLVMTAEQRQSLHILQLSGYELSQYLMEQSLENPVLDIKESDYAYQKNRSNATMDVSQTPVTPP